MSKKPEGQRNVKKVFDFDESRRRRELSSIQIRKEKKDEGLQKRRREVAQPDVASGSSSGGASAAAAAASSSGGGGCGGTASTAPRVGSLPDPGLKAKLDSLPEDVLLLKSSDPADQLDAAQRFRKLLSIERNPPIAEVIGAGVVPRLVQLLQCWDNHALVFEAAWALTNIASGTSEHARVVVDNGAIPIFVQLVRHPFLDVREQAMWALGNIAGDSCRCRDLVLSYNALAVLLEQCREDASTTTVLRNATWTMSNLCRGKQPPRWELVVGALPVLVHLVATSDDEEVITDCCWALSYISDPADRVQPLVEANALQPLSNHLAHASSAVQAPALRTIGNVAAGTPAQTAAALACGLLDRLRGLLLSSKKDIRKESCWILSNLTASSAEHVAAVYNAGLMPRLTEMVGTEEYEIKKEAAYCLCSSVCVASDAQLVQSLVGLGLVGRLCDLLELPDAQLLIAALDALEVILRHGERPLLENPYAQAVDEAGGCDKIEALQMHENTAVYKKAAQLLESFFGAEDQEADAAIAPVARVDGYSFGMES